MPCPLPCPSPAPPWRSAPSTGTFSLWNGRWSGCSRRETFPTGSILTNARQQEAAQRAREAVRRALEALESGLTPDAVLTDAEEALDALGELTGRTAREEIVQQIFSRFCVGK